MKITHYEKRGWRCMSSCLWLAAITHWILARQKHHHHHLLLFLRHHHHHQNLLAFKQESKHPRNSLSSCCWSLLLRISVLEAKSLCQLRKRHDYPIRLRLRYHRSFNSLCLRSLTFFELEFLIMDDQQLDEVFSITPTNLRTWLHILFLGTNGVRRDDVSREFLYTEEKNDLWSDTYRHTMAVQCSRHVCVCDSVWSLWMDGKILKGSGHTILLVRIMDSCWL